MLVYKHQKQNIPIINLFLFYQLFQLKHFQTFNDESFSYISYIEFVLDIPVYIYKVPDCMAERDNITPRDCSGLALEGLYNSTEVYTLQTGMTRFTVTM